MSLCSRAVVTELGDDITAGISKISIERYTQHPSKLIPGRGEVKRNVTESAAEVLKFQSRINNASRRKAFSNLNFPASHRFRHSACRLTSASASGVRRHTVVPKPMRDFQRFEGVTPERIKVLKKGLPGRPCSCSVVRLFGARRV